MSSLLRSKMAEIAEKLEALGISRAPEHRYLDYPNVSVLRYVTPSDPPGVYYTTHFDNSDVLTLLSENDELKIWFHNVPHDVGRYAMAIGYCLCIDGLSLSDKNTICARLRPL